MSFSCSPSALSSFPQPSAAFLCFSSSQQPGCLPVNGALYSPEEQSPPPTMETGGTNSPSNQALAGSQQINDTSTEKNTVTAYTAQSYVTMVFPPFPFVSKQKKCLLFLHRRNCAMQGLAKSPGNACSIWEGWQNTKGTLQCPRVMVRVTHLLFGSPKHQVSNLSAPEALCGWCTTFHPSNISAISQDHTTKCFYI